MAKNIWITGSVELLNHGIHHIKGASGDNKLFEKKLIPTNSLILSLFIKSSTKISII